MADDFKALIAAQKETTRLLMSAEERADMDAAIAEEQHKEKIKSDNRIEGGRKAWQTRQENQKLAAGGSAAKEDAQKKAAADKKNQGLLGKIAGGVTGMFGKMGEKIKGAGKGIMAMLKGTLVAGLLLAVVAFLESPYWTQTKAFIVDTIVPAITKFWGYIKELGPIFKKYFVDTWNNIKELFSGLGDAFDLFSQGEWWEGIKTFFSSIGTFIGKQIDTAVTAIYNIVAHIFGLSKTDSVYGSIWGFLTDTYDEIVSWIKITWFNIKTTISQTFTNIKNFFVDTFNFISEGIAGAWTTVTDFVKGVWDSTILWFKGLWTWASGGIAKGWTNVTTFITGVWDSVVLWFKGLWTWAEAGVAGAWTGIVNFITTQFSGVVTFLKDLFTWPTTPAGFATKLIDIVLLPYNLAINFIRDIFGWGNPDEKFSLGTFIVGIFGKVKDWFKDIFSWKKAEPKEGEEEFSISKMISDLWKNITTALSDIFPSLDDLKAMLPGPGELLGKLKFWDNKAAGGPIAANVPTMVGELGPELILPSSGGQVVNAERTSQIQAAGLRRSAGSGGGGPAVVNAPVNTINNSQNNTSIGATPLTHPNPLLASVNLAA